MEHDNFLESKASAIADCVLHLWGDLEDVSIVNNGHSFK